MAADDEQLLTEAELAERIWTLQQRAIGDMIGAAVLSAADDAEARRRLLAIRDDLAAVAAHLAITL